MTTATEPGVTLPWDLMADAHARLEDARRLAEDAGDDPFDRHDAAEQVREAQGEYDRAADGVGYLGALLLLMALERGCVEKRLLYQLSEALGVSLCFDMARKAKRNALWAENRAREAMAELDAMRVRLGELEERLASLQPGIGQPGRAR